MGMWMWASSVGWAGEPRDPTAYDELIDAMDDRLTDAYGPSDGWGVSGQMFPGVTDIFAPGGKGPEERGEVFTVQTLQPSGVLWFTEDWVLYHPEEVLLGLPLDAHYESERTLWEALPGYQAQSDVAEYGMITFDFHYKRPLADVDTSNLPTTVPSWVTPLCFQVYTVKNNLLEESGVLYRERGDYGSVVDWRDVWILWPNYIRPNPDDPGVYTYLKLLPCNGPIKPFVEDQRTNHPQSRLVVTDREVIRPIPMP
jgi:hypothetical protein